LIHPQGRVYSISTFENKKEKKNIYNVLLLTCIQTVTQLKLTGKPKYYKKVTRIFNIYTGLKVQTHIG